MTRAPVRIQWYARDPVSEIEAARPLSLEERGALATVIDLIYARSNDLPDDDRFIAAHCGCDIRVWRRIKGRLLALGRLYVQTDGSGAARICNAEADAGVAKALAAITAKRDAGRKSGASRADKSARQQSKSKELEPTPVGAPVATGDETSVGDTKTQKNSSPKEKKNSSEEKRVASPARDPAGAQVSLAHNLGDFGDRVIVAHGRVMFETYLARARLDDGRLVAAHPAHVELIRKHFAKELNELEVCSPPRVPEQVAA